MNKIIYFLILLYFMISTAIGCIDMLNKGWRPMSIEERAERAEMVLIIRVLKKQSTPAGISNKKRWYSAHCQIVDILKGLSGRQAKLKLSASLTHTVNINIHGFGKEIDCLSDVKENKVYVLFAMFKVDGNLWARYFSSMGAAELLNKDIYGRVSKTLGLTTWNDWSDCSQNCGLGYRYQTRSTFGGHFADYCWTKRSLPCNWERCTRMIIDKYVNNARQESIRKVGKLGNFKMLLLSVTFNQLSAREAVMIQLIDGQRTIVKINLDNHAIFQISSDKVSRKIQIKAALNDLYAEEAASYFIFIDKNYVNIFYRCHSIRLVEFRNEVVNLSSSDKFKIRWSKLPSTEIRVSNENSDYYQSQFCRDKSTNSKNNKNTNNNNNNKSNGNNDPENVKKIKNKNWSDWSVCSESCGKGLQIRQRPCIDKECQRYKSKQIVQSRECLIKKCEVCSQRCENGGKCITDSCLCPGGYTGDRCELPICTAGCNNKGRCVAPDKCSCLDGYYGVRCEKINCAINCQNGGQCLTPNICTCPLWYFGKRCEKLMCKPECLNNGICSQGNKCNCKPGYTGHRCEKFECYPQCMNGGVCVAPHSCQCKVGFFGSFCERHFCTTCLNGGKCVNDICQCPPGFYGDICQSRQCIASLKFKKIIKPTFVYFPKVSSSKTCHNYKCMTIEPQRTVVVNKVILKPYIGCA